MSGFSGFVPSLIFAVAQIMTQKHEGPGECRSPSFSDCRPPGLGDTEVEALRTFPTTGVTDHFHVSNARFSDSIVYGGLLGYQLIPRVAAELDVYHLSPGLKAQTRLASSPSAGTALVVTRDVDVDFTVAALSVVWNYRLLPSEPVADGRLQLYGGAGVAVFFTDVDATGNTTFAQFRMKDSDTSLGPQLKAGARWFFTRNLGAFLEFRWAHTSFA